MTSILVLIVYLIIVEIIFFRNIEYRYSILSHFLLELIWSILPALIIIHFMIISIALLYISDEHPFFGFQIKVIGHQWYWEYEMVRCYNNIESLYTNMMDSVIPKFNCYVKTDSFKNDFNDYIFVSDTLTHLSVNTNISAHNYMSYESERLLDTEGILYVPYRIHIKLLVTSMDVIHSFAIPSIGIKADAIPGRLNDLHFFLTDNSAMTHYFGQCSELCGVGHAFMPIHMVTI